MYVEALLKPTNRNKPWVFLAGGITGCEDWQKKVKDKILINDCYLINPRRKNFPIEDPNASYEQISWEFEMLSESDLIAFYFSHETIQPIVLYELGRWLHSGKHIILTVNPKYQRKMDVYIQSKLARKNIKINNTLDEHIESINQWIRQPLSEF